MEDRDAADWLIINQNSNIDAQTSDEQNGHDNRHTGRSQRDGDEVRGQQLVVVMLG